MNSKEILELFPQAKSKSMSCFLLMWVHHRFTRICSTLDHSSNSNCYFVNFAESLSQLRTSASFMILVQEFASTIHHLQRPNEFLVNFKPPEKVEKTSTTSPPIFFKQKHTAAFFFWGFPFPGVGKHSRSTNLEISAKKRPSAPRAPWPTCWVRWWSGSWEWCGAGWELGVGNTCPKFYTHTWWIGWEGTWISMFFCFLWERFGEKMVASQLGVNYNLDSRHHHSWIHFRRFLEF